MSPRTNNGPNSQVPSNNRESIDFVTELMSLPAIDLSDPQAIYNRFEEYTALCARHNSKVIIAGMCSALGFTRQELIDWGNGRNPSLDERLRTPEARTALKNCIEKLEVFWEFAMQNDGYRNPVTGIFIAKNNFDYKDTSETLVRHQTERLGPSREQLAEKYAKSLPAEDVVIEPMDEA